MSLMDRKNRGLSGGGASLKDGYRGDIDGLRAIAVISVLFFHARFPGFQGGFTGVDVFFVISGLLIGGHIYAEELSGRFTFASFYRRRAKRILPAFYVVLCAVLVMGSALLSPLELRNAATESIASLLSASNWFYWKVTDYFAVSSDQRTLLMTWSLGVEEQFYLLVPLLMVFLFRYRARAARVLAGLMVLSFVIATYQAAHAPIAAFYLLPARAWELLAGVLLAIVSRPEGRLGTLSTMAQNVAGGLGLLLVLCPIMFLKGTIAFPSPGAVPSVLGAVLILCSPKSWTNRTFLSTGAMTFVGRISYSLYLWHWPLLTFTRIVLGKDPSRVQAALVLMVSALLAFASYLWIEQPFRNSSIQTRTLLMRYGAVTAFVVLVCVGIRHAGGLAVRAPDLSREEATVFAAEQTCLAPSGQSKVQQSSGCVEQGGRAAVALWGDSHAGALGAALRSKVHESGYDFVQMTKSSCPPLENTARYFRDTPNLAIECLAFNDEALREIQAQPRIQIVVLASYWRISLTEPYERGTGWIVGRESLRAPMPSLSTTRQIFSESLFRTVTTLRAAGKQVLVLQDVPGFAVEPLWRLRTESLPVRRWLAGELQLPTPIDPGTDFAADPETDDMARGIVSGAAGSAGATVVDLEATLCSAQRKCRYRDTDRIFYRDRQHVTFAGANAALSGVTLTQPR